MLSHVCLLSFLFFGSSTWAFVPPLPHHQLRVVTPKTKVNSYLQPRRSFRERSSCLSMKIETEEEEGDKVSLSEERESRSLLERVKGFMMDEENRKDTVM